MVQLELDTCDGDSDWIGSRQFTSEQCQLSKCHCIKQVRRLL